MLTLTRQPDARIAPFESGTALDIVRRFCSSAGFAYGMIILLQMKVLWRIWDFKDITSGDTISYYQGACVGLDRLRFNFAWSPLYAFLGSLLLRISHDPYFYCIATRVILVLAITVLTLAVMRRLVPPAAAWLVAAWWALLPINFNTLYEVHLFAVVPILTTWLILLSNNDSKWRRGVALAIMVASAVLIRNEQTLYGAFFAACIAVSEIRAFWLAKRSGASDPHASAAGHRTLPQSVKPYVVPLVLSLCLIATFFVRSSLHLADLAPVLRHKHTNNVGQMYCFGYQQRYPGLWNKSAWTEYGDLMTKHFGGPELTIIEAAVRNPRAMAEHLWWNASLIPSGLQLLLFNRIAGTITPDYVDPPMGFWRATLLSLLVVAIIAGGVVVAIREKVWLQDWVRTRSWGLIAMACYAPVAVIVMIMQRPRASYVFAFGITLMGLVGFCAWRLFAKLLVKQQQSSAGSALPAVSTDSRAKFASYRPLWSAAASLVLVAVTPAYYPQHSHGRPLLDYIHFLQPFSSILSSHEDRILAPAESEEIAYYLYGASGSIVAHHWVTPISIPDLFVPKTDISKVLIAHDIKHAIIDRPMFAPPAFDQLATAKDWRLIGLQKLPARTLSLYTRSTLYEDKK